MHLRQEEVIPGLACPIPLSSWCSCLLNAWWPRPKTWRPRSGRTCPSSGRGSPRRNLSYSHKRVITNAFFWSVFKKSNTIKDLFGEQTNSQTFFGRINNSSWRNLDFPPKNMLFSKKVHEYVQEWKIYSMNFADFKLSLDEKLKFEQIIEQNLLNSGLFWKNISFSLHLWSFWRIC